MAHILPRRQDVFINPWGEGFSAVNLSILPGLSSLTPTKFLSFESPRLISLPYVSCPWTCTLCVPYCWLICVPMIWGEILKSLSQRLLYLFLGHQAQPRSMICLEDALGSEWMWWGQCCWELGFGGSRLDRMCVKSFGFLNITCGISQSPQMVKICERSLSWSRHLKLLSFTQVSNPRDSKWKRTEFRIKVS